VSVTPQRNRSVFIAAYMVVTSVVGGSLANLAGGKLLSLMGELNFSILGIQFDRYKVLFAGACVLRLLIVLLLLPTIAHLKQSNAENTETNEIERVDSDDGKEPA
jgi:hypothetical protein